MQTIAIQLKKVPGLSARKKAKKISRIKDDLAEATEYAYKIY